MNIDPIPLSSDEVHQAGGREFERTLACAWCTGVDLAPVELGGPKGRMDIVYGCRDCRRETALVIPFSQAGNRVWVIRVYKRKGNWYRGGRTQPGADTASVMRPDQLDQVVIGPDGQVHDS